MKEVRFVLVSEPIQFLFIPRIVLNMYIKLTPCMQREIWVYLGTCTVSIESGEEVVG
jgi:hypothetical protein